MTIRLKKTCKGACLFSKCCRKTSKEKAKQCPIEILSCCQKVIIQHKLLLRSPNTLCFNLHEIYSLKSSLFIYHEKYVYLLTSMKISFINQMSWGIVSNLIEYFLKKSNKRKFGYDWWYCLLPNLKTQSRNMSLIISQCFVERGKVCY